MLQILDAMNMADSINGTSNVIVGNTLISATYSKAGTKVTIGVGGNQVSDLLSGEKIALLILVDMKEYKRLEQS